MSVSYGFLCFYLGFPAVSALAEIKGKLYHSETIVPSESGGDGFLSEICYALTLFKGGVTKVNEKFLTFVADIVMRITRYL